MDLLTIVLLVVLVAVVVFTIKTFPGRAKAAEARRQARIAAREAAHGRIAGAGAPNDLLVAGMSHSSNATLFGVLGLFFFGVVFGPLAISQANKAESYGVTATAGRVLGIISTTLAVLSVGVVVVLLFLGLSRH